MLRPTPGALSPHRLETRPASLPSQLFIHGGRPPTRFSAVVLEPEGPRLVDLAKPEQLEALYATGLPIWLRVAGLAEPRRIATFLEAVAIPQMLLDPLLDLPQRPRVDCVDSALVVVLHRLGFAHDLSHLVSSQVGFLLVPNLLVTLEEASTGDGFPRITAWLKERIGAPEHQDLDDILHFLVDELLDDVFPILEQIATRLDSLEEAVLRDPKPKLLSKAFAYRSNIRAIRSTVWPLRHQVRMLLRQHQPLLGPDAEGGFRDMGEIVEMLFENCELLRHQCDSITQAYAASVGNRMNQVMKTLTILTSIFAPLTFIGGIYGMNFDTMPELHWRYGYLYALLLMLVIALVQAYWLWRRGWFQDWTLPR